MRTAMIAMLLTAAPAAAQTDTVTPPPPAPVAADKYKTELVCKTRLETGSLIAKRKMCLTRRQWSYVDDQNQAFVHKMQEDNAGKGNGFGP